MKIETLQEGNQIAARLREWANVETRLSCGGMFYQIRFIGPANKTMDSVEMIVTDDMVISSFKVLANEMVKKYTEELEKL